MSPPPKYGIERIAHTRGSPAPVDPGHCAFYGAKRLGQCKGGSARGAAPELRENLASQANGCGMQATLRSAHA